MSEFYQQGDTIDYTPAANVAAGEVVVIGDLVAVATTNIPANTLGAVEVEGVFRMPKAAGTAIPAGTKVYWDDAAKQATATAGSLKAVGYTIAAAAEADEVVLVKLDR